MSASWPTERVIANPMGHPHFEYVERRLSWYGQMAAGVVRVIIADGKGRPRLHGLRGGDAAAVVLREQVRRLLVGKDCSRPA